MFLEYLIFLVPNLFFLCYWITRSNPILKYLATVGLSFYVLFYCQDDILVTTLQFILFSMGDLVLETGTLNQSLVFFGLGKIIKLLKYRAYTSILISLTYSLFIFKQTRKLIYGYVVLHLLHFYVIYHYANIWHIRSNVLFILSDILIGLDIIGYRLPNYEYISYPLYWFSNLCSIVSSRF